MENPLPRPNWNPNPGIAARPIPNSGLAGQPSRKEVLCFKCHQPGHIARNCRHGRLFGQGLSRTREPEALGRPPTTKTAAVTPDNKGTQLAEEASEEPLTWLYGAQPAQGVENFPGPGSDSGQPPRLGSTPKLPVTIEGIEVQQQSYPRHYAEKFWINKRNKIVTQPLKHTDTEWLKISN